MPCLAELGWKLGRLLLQAASNEKQCHASACNCCISISTTCYFCLICDSWVLDNIHRCLDSCVLQNQLLLAGVQQEGPKPSPAGAFNPYGVKDEDMIKAGKRSSVNVRSGNRSQTFAN